MINIQQYLNLTINSKTLIFKLFLLFFAITPNITTAESFRITYKNNTPQTLTSAVCVSHNNRFNLFKLETTASKGIVNLAQDGVTEDLEDEIRRKKGVEQVVIGSFLSAQRTTSLKINAKKNSRISCIFGMLVATNDGFTAIRSIKLPQKLKGKVNFTGNAYDSGSEINTESCNDVPGGPCNSHFVGLAENAKIKLHEGIKGIADLSIETHGWSEPAIVGSINRIK